MITTASTAVEVVAFLSENGLTLEARREKPRRFVVTLSDSATMGQRWRREVVATSFEKSFDIAVRLAEKAAPLFEK